MDEATMWLSHPGGHHLQAGLPELSRATALSELSESALVLLMARPKLNELGIALACGLDPTPEAIKARLLDRLEDRLGTDQQAHAAYKALQREIISFARTYAALSLSQPPRSRKA